MVRQLVCLATHDRWPLTKAGGVGGGSSYIRVRDDRIWPPTAGCATGQHPGDDGSPACRSFKGERKGGGETQPCRRHPRLRPGIPGLAQAEAERRSRTLRLLAAARWVAARVAQGATRGLGRAAVRFRIPFDSPTIPISSCLLGSAKDQRNESPHLYIILSKVHHCRVIPVSKFTNRSFRSLNLFVYIISISKLFQLCHPGLQT